MWVAVSPRFWMLEEEGVGYPLVRPFLCWVTCGGIGCMSYSPYPGQGSVKPRKPWSKVKVSPKAWLSAFLILLNRIPHRVVTPSQKIIYFCCYFVTAILLLLWVIMWISVFPMVLGDPCARIAPQGLTSAWEPVPQGVFPGYIVKGT